MQTTPVAAPRKQKRKPPVSALVALFFMRLAFGICSVVAPRVTAERARRLLLTPPRARRGDDERQLLAHGESLQLQLDNAPVRATSWGHGPKVLLVHGWGGHAGQMTAFVEPLLQAGFQAIAIDMPGHGGSPGKVSSVAHFSRAIEAAAEQWGPFHAVIAHSFGCGGVVRALTQHGVSVRRLVFFGPVAYFGPSWKRFARMIGLGRRTLQLTLESAQRSLGMRFEEAEPARLAPGQSTPLIVIHDRGDKETPFSDGEEVARRWPGAILVSTDDLGHVRILKDRAAVAQAVAFATGSHAASESRGYADASSL